MVHRIDEFAKIGATPVKIQWRICTRAEFEGEVKAAFALLVYAVRQHADEAVRRPL